MLRVIKQNIAGLKYPIYASLALAFASFGDAFLYPFLPQYFEVMQVPIVWIGVLLSVNRFIRILFNPLVVKLFARYGARRVTIVAALMAIVSTGGYGLGWGLFSLLVFRVVWGMAFAVLRISSISYALQHPYPGTSLGIGKGLQEAGPLFALWLGPFLLNYFLPSDVFMLFALLSIPSLLYAMLLPELQYTPAITKATFRLPSIFNMITFILSFIVEGLLIIVIGLFLTKNNTSLTNWEIASLAAGYLAFRRICFILFAPISGAIADKIGFTSVFRTSVILIISGFILLLVGCETVGLLTIFTFNSVNSTVAPGEASGRGDQVKAVTVNATWRDFGAAIGTITGGFLLPGHFVSETFTIATFILAVLTIFYFRK